MQFPLSCNSSKKWIMFPGLVSSAQSRQNSVSCIHVNHFNTWVLLVLYRIGICWSQDTLIPSKSMQNSLLILRFETLISTCTAFLLVHFTTNRCFITALIHLYYAFFYIVVKWKKKRHYFYAATSLCCDYAC